MDGLEDGCEGGYGRTEFSFMKNSWINLNKIIFSKNFCKVSMKIPRINQDKIIKSVINFAGILKKIHEFNL